MVKPVEQDSRGIIDPASGLTAFRLTRHAASGGLDRFVDRYWIATWDLPPGTEHTQSVLVHPVVNIVFDAGGTVSGVQERTFTRTLAGSGRVLGIMFRPAGFRPFWERPARELTNRALPLTTVLGPDAGALQAALDAAEDEEARWKRQSASSARTSPMTSTLARRRRPWWSGSRATAASGGSTRSRSSPALG